MRCLAGLCLVVGVLAAAPVAAQTKDPAEEVVRKMLAELVKLHDTLAAIKTDEGAKAAHKDLKEIVAAIVALRKEGDKLPPPARDVKDLLAKEYRPKFVAIQAKLTEQVVRVRVFPSGREILTEVSALLANKEVKGKEKDKEKDKSKDG